MIRKAVSIWKKKIINTHFTIETRTIIENLLNEGKSVTEISKFLQRDRSNIGREIFKHRKIVFPSIFNKYHPCLKHETCNAKSYECYLNCKMIEFNLCQKLNSSPHVCNGCQTKNGCRHIKYYYKATEANNEYLISRTNDRTGLHYTEEELKILNTVFKILVLNCKSIYHAIKVINNRCYNFKLINIYKQIARGQLELKPQALPRNRINKKSKNKDNSYKRECIEGHTYEDFLIYKNLHPTVIEMQMDTVSGKIDGSKILLTLIFRKSNFLIALLVDNKKAKL